MTNRLGEEIPQPITYYGEADILGQLSYELINHPNSCLSKNLVGWYNALYSANSNNADCSYQVEINKSLCPSNLASNAQELTFYLNSLVFQGIATVLIDFLVFTASKLSKTAGRKLINDYRASLLSKFNALL
jgi:hypothetical protein